MYVHKCTKIAPDVFAYLFHYRASGAVGLPKQIFHVLHYVHVQFVTIGRL